MAFTHILVPTDFSETANAAVAYALREAELHQANVIVLHVLQHRSDTDVHYLRGGPTDPRGFITEFGGPLPVYTGQETSVIRQDHIEEATTKLRDLLPHAFAESATVEVSRGDPADTIIHLAQERGVDLIVMGTHGRTGLAHLLLGSVAEKVVRRAPCSVLVTRQHDAA